MDWPSVRFMTAKSIHTHTAGMTDFQLELLWSLQGVQVVVETNRFVKENDRCKLKFKHIIVNPTSTFSIWTSQPFRVIQDWVKAIAVNQFCNVIGGCGIFSNCIGNWSMIPLKSCWIAFNFKWFLTAVFA